MKFKYANDTETKFVRALLYVMREIAIKYNYYLSDVGYANIVKFKEHKRVNVLTSVDYYSNSHQPRISKILDEMDHILQPNIVFYKHKDSYILRFVDNEYNMIRLNFILCDNNNIIVKEIQSYNDGYDQYWFQLKFDLLHTFARLGFNDLKLITIGSIVKNKSEVIK